MDGRDGESDFDLLPKPPLPTVLPERLASKAFWLRAFESVRWTVVEFLPAFGDRTVPDADAGALRNVVVLVMVVTRLLYAWYGTIPNGW